jgi:hypothetical protein
LTKTNFGEENVFLLFYRRPKSFGFVEKFISFFVSINFIETKNEKRIESAERHLPDLLGGKIGMSTSVRTLVSSLRLEDRSFSINIIGVASDGKNRIFYRVDDRANETRQKHGSKFLSGKMLRNFLPKILFVKTDCRFVFATERI